MYWMTNNCHGQIFAYCLDTELQCWQSSKGFSVNPVAQIEFCCGLSNFDGSGQWCEEKQLCLVNFDMN